MREVHITLVNQHDFTGLDPGAQFPCPLVVVLAGGVDDDKVGQQALQVKPHVRFGGGFTSPFGPATQLATNSITVVSTT